MVLLVANVLIVSGRAVIAQEFARFAVIAKVFASEFLSEETLLVYG